MKQRKHRRLAAVLAAALAMQALLSGCGAGTASIDPVPEGVPDAVQDMPEYGTDETANTDPGRQGYDLDVEPNGGVLASLLADYDRSTAVSVDASDEMAAMAAAHDQGPAVSDASVTGQDGPVPDAPSTIEPEPVAMTAEPAPLPLILKPKAPGTAAMSNSSCVIDYSNSGDGYFMSRWLASPQKIKLQSTGPSGTTYTYDLYGNEWSAFPFSDGNGSYNVRVMQNIGGTKYAVAGSAEIGVDMADEFAPFLRPNQYVNYESAADATAMASELCRGKTSELDKVAAVYDWVVANLSYDKHKARTVQSGYLPDLDAVMAAKTGICFDYAALMAGMLRSQGVACRLVVGYAGSAYHAWISVYVTGQGWVDGVIFFDGSSWQRMDPTFASTGKGSQAIMKYIGDGSNYSAKYLY